MKRLTSDWYERIARPLLFRMDPESAHHLALRFLRLAPHLPGAMAFLRSYAPPPRPRALFGLQFPNPIGLAAGFDKNGVAIPAWEALGFGFVEVGTVTAQAQPGNPRPRIFRYPREQALINRLGFNNDGADVVAERLRRLRASRWRPSIPIGVNIGKTKITPLEKAAEEGSDRAVDAVLKGEKHAAEHEKAAHDARRSVQGKEIARPQRAAADKG